MHVNNMMYAKLKSWHHCQYATVARRCWLFYQSKNVIGICEDLVKALPEAFTNEAKTNVYALILAPLLARALNDLERIRKPSPMLRLLMESRRRASFFPN